MKDMTATVFLAHEVKPAGGAALGEVIIASVIGLGLTAALLGLVYLHRTRRTRALTSIGTRLGRITGMPPWVALPTLLATSSLLAALFGMMWDISFHIDDGRDPGPLANPAHYFILFGLFGVFAAGVLACAMPLDARPGPSPIRFIQGWYVPIGGVLMTASGFYALLGFPLDDIWHRIFGQDVTLWGPTHLMLIGGAGLSLVGILVLEHEGQAATRAVEGSKATPRLAQFLRRGSAIGGLLLGLSVFQGEFDFDVPQFRLVLEPFMIAVAAGIALVAARLLMGRGGALWTAVFFVVVRGLVSLLVGPVLGQTTPTFPLYVGSAILVELLALVAPLIRRPLAFAAASGVLIGTLGTLTEAGWSNLLRTLKWGGDMAVEGTLMSVGGGVAGAVLGALLFLGLRHRLPRPAIARTLVIACVLALGGLTANGLILSHPTGVRATFDVQASGTSPRTGTITAHVTPADAVDHPSWVQFVSWQGGGLVVEKAQRVGPGVYRTTKPVPLSGDWKTLLRVGDGRVLMAAPIYLPADPEIHKPEIPATSGVTRTLGPEKPIFQREVKDGVPAWLWNACCLGVLLCSLALVTAISWGVARYSRGAGGRVETAPPVRAPAPVPVGGH